MKKFNTESGMPGVRLYIEGKFGEYNMNGDVDRNLELQKLHEDLAIEVIIDLTNVTYDEAKSLYSIAYYYGHAQNIEAIDKYIEVIIQGITVIS